jgi:hypothetical protein
LEQFQQKKINNSQIELQNQLLMKESEIKVLGCKIEQLVQDLKVEKDNSFKASLLLEQQKSEFEMERKEITAQFEFEKKKLLEQIEEEKFKSKQIICGDEKYEQENMNLNEARQAFEKQKRE